MTPGLKTVRVRAVAMKASLLIFGLAGLLPFHSAQAKGCTGTWNYSESSLQNARRRLKSPALPNSASRVECGTDLTEALKLAEWPGDCPPCRREYIGLLRDLIVYTRAAGDHASAVKNKTAFYAREVSTRIVFGDFLLSVNDEQLIDQYWSDNFDGMGDAMDLAGMGRDFHREASRNRNRVFSEKTFETWTRAIRSCPTWDFRKGRNMDIPKLRVSLLCEDECRRALSRIRQRAEGGQAADKEAVAEIIDDVLPVLEACSTGGSP